MACHILGAPNMALKLGAPTSVECIKKEGVSNFMFPKASTIKFEFPARGNMPPVTLYWYDGLKEQPKIKGVPEGEYLGDLPRVGGGGRGQGRGAAGGAGATAAAGRGRSPRRRRAGSSARSSVGTTPIYRPRSVRA